MTSQVLKDKIRFVKVRFHTPRRAKLVTLGVRGYGIGVMDLPVRRGWALLNTLPNAVICAKPYQGAIFHSEIGKYFIGATSACILLVNSTAYKKYL